VLMTFDVGIVTVVSNSIAYAVEAVRPQDGLADCSGPVSRGIGIGEVKFPDPTKARNDFVFEDEFIPLGVLACAEVQGARHARAHEVMLPFVVIGGWGVLPVPSAGPKGFDRVLCDPVDVEIPVRAASSILLDGVEERRAPVVTVRLMAKIAHAVKGALLIAAQVLGELVERCGRLMPEAVHGLEPDEIGLFERDMLPGRDRDVPQAAA
jgi:hypothetical protein